MEVWLIIFYSSSVAPAAQIVIGLSLAGQRFSGRSTGFESDGSFRPGVGAFPNPAGIQWLMQTPYSVTVAGAAVGLVEDLTTLPDYPRGAPDAFEL